MNASGKYALLYRWFKNQPPEKTAIDLSFAQIEKILGSKLPPSPGDMNLGGVIRAQALAMCKP